MTALGAAADGYHPTVFIAALNRRPVFIIGRKHQHDAVNPLTGQQGIEAVQEYESDKGN